MSLAPKEVKKIAHLARLSLSEDDVALFSTQLSHILDLIEQMNRIDTAEIEPLSHPLNVTQRLRPDQITEVNQRDKFQTIAPQVEAGLYLVPKVIDEA